MIRLFIFIRFRYLSSLGAQPLLIYWKLLILYLLQFIYLYLLQFFFPYPTIEFGLWNHRVNLFFWLLDSYFLIMMIPLINGLRRLLLPLRLGFLFWIMVLSKINMNDFLQVRRLNCASASWVVCHMFS